MKICGKLPGTAVIEVSGAAVEGFLNICLSRGLTPISVHRNGEFCMLLELPAAQLDEAQASAMRSQCTLRVIRQGSAVRAAKIFRRRAAGIFLAMLFIGLLFWSKFFVWEIQVNGNRNVSTGRILSALDACGVETGAFWPDFSQEDIRNRVLVLMPELAWISVNMHGSLAQVQVVERVPPPEMLHEGEPADIVAAEDGFIVNISALVGTAAVGRGSAVEKGDVLISGAVESGFSPPRLLRAQGSISAEIFRSISIVSPEIVQLKSYTGKERSRFAIIVGDKRINFYSDSSILGQKCDTIISVWKAEIKGLFSLPLALVRERDRFYETTNTANQDCGLLLDTVLDEQLRLCIGNGEVLEQDRKRFSLDGLIYATLRARCLEDIGLLQPMDSQRQNEINYIYQQKANDKNG